MKRLHSIACFVVLSVFLLHVSSCSNNARQNTAKNDLQILVVAGGHRYDTLAFNQIFDNMDDLEVEFVIQPHANAMISRGEADHFDAIVFYDDWKQITEDEKQGYLQLLEKGTGMIFLHHALVSYQDWPEFTRIIGGKYKKARFEGDTTNLSGFKHDINLHVVASPDHPITRGIGEFDIFDEGYTHIDVLPDVTPLLTTTHEFSHPTIGWAHEVKNSRVVYLLPGHAAPGLQNEVYQKIIQRAINWSAQNIK